MARLNLQSVACKASFLPQSHWAHCNQRSENPIYFYPYLCWQSAE